MKKTILYLTILALFGFGCANRLYKKGLNNYKQMAYAGAITNFEDYLRKNNKPDAAIKLADSYRLINDIPNAEKWFAKTVTLPESDPINMFHYARILMRVENYAEAKIWFTKYLQIVPDDFAAEMLLFSCNTIKSFKTDTTLYTLKEVEMPDVATSFASKPYQSGIMFTADKLVFKKSGKYPWTGRSYLDLYFSKKDKSGKWLSPMNLKGDVNTEFHEGPACFTNEGNIVYFTRSNIKDGKLKKNSKNESNMKLFRAELVGEKWTNLFELPFNNDNYSCGHPCLSPDEKTLYFISDMPGGLGNTDIYKSTLNGTTWSAPENLGSTINTSGYEMFPYMHIDGTFYFSSEAHKNLGGLDVFMTYFDGKKWLQVENLNYPLNSSGDDFAYVPDKENKTGFVSSNRDGEDKMFEVTKNEPTFILNGIVKHKGKPIPIDSAKIEIYNYNSKLTETIYTAKNGLYKTKLKSNCEYTIKASKAMFFPVTAPKTISTRGKKISETFVANFELDQLIIEKPIVLQNIYYDLDKWYIRADAALELDKLVQVLLDNPKIHIELSSHTDSRAGDQYNLVLSDKRAKAAVEYLVSKGIDFGRLKWKGYGESMLLNRCQNNVICTEDEHQENRRTEFKLLKTPSSISKL